MDDILEVNGLYVTFRTASSHVRAVRDVSFTLRAGTTLGLVGESGCGKSVTAYSLLRLVPPPGVIDAGSIRYRGRDLLQMDDEEIRAIRGKEIAMIFQEPMTSLNPVFTVGRQISESLILHLGMTRRAARDRAIELLHSAGMPDPRRIFDAYPHELSGGMRQRAMIAMALAASPSILIADEPTTALDVTIQAQILDLLKKLQKERNMTLLLITHDLGIVASLADEIAIMYAGEIVERGTTAEVFKKPAHPYTAGLFKAIPRIGATRGKLRVIPGTVPEVRDEPTGCVFYPRCGRAIDRCAHAPVVLKRCGGRRAVRCIRYRPATAVRRGAG